MFSLQHAQEVLHELQSKGFNPDTIVINDRDFEDLNFERKNSPVAGFPKDFPDHHPILIWNKTFIASKQVPSGKALAVVNHDAKGSTNTPTIEQISRMADHLCETLLELEHRRHDLTMREKVTTALRAYFKSTTDNQQSTINHQQS